MRTSETSEAVNDGVGDMSEDCEKCCDSGQEDINMSCEILRAENGYVVITDNGTLIALNIEEALDIARGVLG